jgi:hypothetical protein
MQAGTADLFGYALEQGSFNRLRKNPCPNRHRFDFVLAYCRDVANDAWQGP